MSTFASLGIACDVRSCDNEAEINFQDATLPENPVEYMRERCAETPRAWRVIDDKDVCYRHRGETEFEWEEW